MNLPSSTIDYKQLERRTYYRGRVALHAILKGLGIGRGDQVATQAFTCAAVPEAIRASGATPLYIDIEPHGYNLDPESLRERLTPATRAVIVQHTFGIPAAMDALTSIAKQRGIPIIEDCCHTLLSTYGGRQVGTFGVASFYSYEWGKPVAVGLGGGAVANDPLLAATLDTDYANYATPSLRRQMKIEIQRVVHALLYRPSLYWALKAAFHRLSQLGAAEGNYNALKEQNSEQDEEQQIGGDFSLAMSPRLRKTFLRRLATLQQIAEQSQRLTREYARLLTPSPVGLPVVYDQSDVVFSRYPIRAVDKQRLIARARESRIELAPWYATPVHPLTEDALSTVGYEPGACPAAERRAAEIVSLPINSRVDPRYVEQVGLLFVEAA